ncbi:guanyl-specific ribonuclease Sa [Streptomyces sp. V3I8]|uniref:hypothetical protein n=1 Tax=Streptomyces sp. V3I8 TaxID=3042279 RepID=UPI002780EB5D|nr:hypothetical protein [Streptomyces sp. V3I8]MDQ1041548.1 guanyl-specific ribonuclease Sa [Streptomyces sp. V3I8]
MASIDEPARQNITRKVDRERREMAKEATDLQREVQRFCADIIRGGPYAGRARNIARDAVELAARAAALDAASDVADAVLPQDENAPGVD